MGRGGERPPNSTESELLVQVTFFILRYGEGGERGADEGGGVDTLRGVDDVFLAVEVAQGCQSVVCGRVVPNLHLCHHMPGGVPEHGLRSVLQEVGSTLGDGPPRALH